MTREETVEAALSLVSAATKKFGHCPEGAAFFMGLWRDLEREAKNILAYPHLTEKEKL